MFLSFLSIVGVGAVLTHVVLLYKQRIHSELGGFLERYRRHLGTLLHNLGIVNGIVG